MTNPPEPEISPPVYKAGPTFNLSRELARDLGLLPACDLCGADIKRVPAEDPGDRDWWVCVNDRCKRQRPIEQDDLR